MCTLAINSQYNGIELTFEERPTVAVRDSLKALGFRWHGVKKLWYAKNTAERMELANTLAGNTTATASAPIESPARTTRTQRTAAPAAEPVSKYGIKVGDILSDTWGYSMTIVEFYKVTRIVSPCKVEIVELGQAYTEGGNGDGYVIPDTTAEGRERIVKQVVATRCGDWNIKINGSVRLTPWNGRPKYQNLYD